MSKIFNFYAKNDENVDVDYCWYDSSNVKFSKCLDYDNKLKTLIVVFTNGTQYEYKNVDVSKYLLFKEDVSQGKALNKYIKAEKYEYKKLENADLNALDEELDFRLNDGVFVTYDGEKLVMKNNKDEIILEREVKLTMTAFEAICCALEAVGKRLYTEGQNFVSYE